MFDPRDDFHIIYGEALCLFELRSSLVTNLTCGFVYCTLSRFAFAGKPLCFG